MPRYKAGHIDALIWPSLGTPWSAARSRNHTPIRLARELGDNLGLTAAHELSGIPLLLNHPDLASYDSA